VGDGLTFTSGGASSARRGWTDRRRRGATSGIIATCDPVRDRYGRIDAFQVGGKTLKAVGGGGRTAFKCDDDGQEAWSGRVPNARTWEQRNAIVAASVPKSHVRERAVLKEAN
jgi:hypothetical protein